MRRALTLAAVFGMGVWLAGCPETEAPAAPTQRAAAGPSGPGVDTEAKVLRVGALNDESGPASAIGHPFAAGKRILAAQVNAGDSGLLPDGWRLELVEQDHGYDPRRAVEAYDEIHDRVLFLATSFGTRTTLPLRPRLERDGMVAFPASLSSEMAGFAYTPPIGTPYALEAMRAMDWAVEEAGSPEKVKAGVVHQADDYGRDGLEGWKQAARHHGVQVVSEQVVAPDQTDYASVVTGLQDAGANYVLLATLPTATGPLLETAARRDYAPRWIGNTPAWTDRFFDRAELSEEALDGFHWATGLRYWGEDVPGMDTFLAAYERWGRDLTEPDFYALLSYVQGLTALEAARRALEEGPLTRETYLESLRSLTDFEPGGGLLPPVDLSRFPYRTQDEARILEPRRLERSWKVVGDAAAPQGLAGPRRPDGDAGDAAGTP